MTGETPVLLLNEISASIRIFSFFVVPDPCMGVSLIYVYRGIKETGPVIFSPSIFAAKKVSIYSPAMHIILSLLCLEI